MLTPLNQDLTFTLFEMPRCVFPRQYLKMNASTINLYTHPISLCTKTIIHSFCKDCEFRISFAMSCFTSPLPTIHIAPLQSQSVKSAKAWHWHQRYRREASWGGVFFSGILEIVMSHLVLFFLPRSLVVKILLIKPNVLQKTNSIFQTKKKY